MRRGLLSALLLFVLVAGAQSASADTDFDIAVQQSVQRYPFLDSGSPGADLTAINAVVDRRNIYIQQGLSPADALTRAVSDVAPSFETQHMSDQRESQRSTNAPTALDHYNQYLRAQEDEHNRLRQEQADNWASSTAAESAVAQRNRAEENSRQARIAAGALRQYGNSARADREIRRSIMAGRSGYDATGQRKEDDFRSGRATTIQMPARNSDDDEPVRRSFVNGNGDTFTPNENGYSSATGGGQFYDKGNDRYYSPQSGALCKRELNEMKCQ